RPLELPCLGPAISTPPGGVADARSHLQRDGDVCNAYLVAGARAAFGLALSVRSLVRPSRGWFRPPRAPAGGRSAVGGTLPPPATATCAVFRDGARLLEPAPIYHDNGALAYPLRVLVSTSLWHGVLPLWDHWTDGGAPLCSLVVALPLSPIVLVLSAFGIYRPTTFLVELVTLHVLALLGMYRWLCDLADEWAALLGATAYALSAIMLVQAPINLESVASQAMFPWYALGLRQSLRGERRGAAKVAVSLWIMFTTGYLGLNLFALEILTAYVVVDHLVIEHRRLEPGRRRRGLWY